MLLQILNDIIFPLAALTISIIALVRASRAQIASKRPHLVFVDLIVSDTGVKKTGFYLINLGHGPAFNIDIPDEFLKSHSFLTAFRDIPRNLAPEGKTLFALTEGVSRFITPEVAIEVTYEDHEGIVYKTMLSNMRHSFKKV